MNDSDILVGIFWTKLGTPTGVDVSGSVEEIKEFRSKGKPVLLYFSDVPVAPDKIDAKQHQALKTFRAKCYSEGLVDTYNSVSELHKKLSRHLLETMRRLQNDKVNAQILPTQISPPTNLTSEDTKVDIDLQHFISRVTDEFEEYKLIVNLINRDSKTISAYRLDIEFPQAFLNSHTRNVMEVSGRSNEKFNISELRKVITITK